MSAIVLTKSLVDVWNSHETAIIKREKVDLEWLDFLRKNPNVPKDQRALLKKWSEVIKEGCWAEVAYTLGKKAAESENHLLGRLNVNGNVGLQAFQHDVRNALGHRNYWDIDMVAAHPTLCRQLCVRLNLPTKYQDELIQNRDEKIVELMDLNKCERKGAKERVTAIYFGEENTCASLPEFYKNLWLENDTARKVITQDSNWFDALKFLNGKRKNRLGSAFAYILQTIERGCLLAMEKSAKANGRSLDTYIHDGGLIRKREGESKFPDILLRAFEDDIERETGFRVKLLSKPMTTSYSLGKNVNDAYLELKEKFERECCKILNPCVYVRVHEGETQMLTLSELHHVYSDWKFDEEKFLNKWLEDDTKRTYDKFTFLPALECPPNHYNLWTGFGESEPGDVSVIQEVLMTLCDYDKKVFDYVERWVASMIQRPSVKNGTCIIFQSDVQGAGKDTYGNFICSLMGCEYSANILDAANEVFGRFNSQHKKRIFLKFEEAPFIENKTHREMFKALITCDRKEYEQKGHPSITLNCYFNIMMTTNNKVPALLEDRERRMVLIKCNEERVGQYEYWKAVHKTLAKEETRRAYLHYLMNLDISNFNPRDDRPITKFYEEIKLASRPYHARFFQNQIEDDEYGLVDVGVSGRDLCKAINTGSKFEFSEQVVGRDCNQYIEVGALRKQRFAKGTRYLMDKENMREYLVKKGWWNDFLD